MTSMFVRPIFSYTNHNPSAGTRALGCSKNSTNNSSRPDKVTSAAQAVFTGTAKATSAPDYCQLLTDLGIKTGLLSMVNSPIARKELTRTLIDERFDLWEGEIGKSNANIPSILTLEQYKEKLKTHGFKKGDLSGLVEHIVKLIETLVPKESSRSDEESTVDTEAQQTVRNSNSKNPSGLADDGQEVEHLPASTKTPSLTEQNLLLHSGKKIPHNDPKETSSLSSNSKHSSEGISGVLTSIAKAVTKAAEEVFSAIISGAAYVVWALTSGYKKTAKEVVEKNTTITGIRIWATTLSDIIFGPQETRKTTTPPIRSEKELTHLQDLKNTIDKLDNNLIDLRDKYFEALKSENGIDDPALQSMIQSLNTFEEAVDVIVGSKIMHELSEGLNENTADSFARLRMRISNFRSLLIPQTEVSHKIAPKNARHIPTPPRLEEIRRRAFELQAKRKQEAAARYEQRKHEFDRRVQERLSELSTKSLKRAKNR